ncbi:MAG: sigma-70 family RNA polymerase sigma factor [Ruminococcaceae bacterium]|nr:sigma-70 family RNA polymerase sigma factor [Oscillospiraceae bacterium]
MTKPQASVNQTAKDFVALTETIRRAKNGDQAAFEALLDRYTPLIDSMVGRFASDSATAEDREDLRQEALVGFYKAMMHFDDSQSEVQFGLYARECLQNRMISYLRSQQKHQRVVLLEDGALIEKAAQVSEGDPASLLADEEAYLLLSRRIREILSGYENRVWWLYLSGRTAKEIAAMLQTEEKSVSNAIYRIRRKLRAVIPYSP